MLHTTSCDFSPSSPSSWRPFPPSPLRSCWALEDTQGTSSEVKNFRSVRAVFFKAGSDWKPFPADCISEACLRKLETDFPRETNWTIAFDGHKIGDVRTCIPAEIDTYSRVGQQQIVTAGPKGRVPTIGLRTKEFAGFMDDPVFRPLVAISEPNVRDPDVWKPAPLDAAATAAIRSEFRKKYPKITDCEVEELRDYSDQDLKFLKSYTAKSGWHLVLTSLTGCDISDLRGDGLDLEWFTIDPAGAVHYLHGNMRFVDAGDYDNSGHSQLLFMIDDYNRGGYRLYYDAFQKSAVFEYTFH
jgi:hypothetical protein